MPSYYNPYLYQQGYGTSGLYNQNYVPAPAPQSYAVQQPVTSPYKVMEYVDGEIGAIAYQLPPGWPPNTFFPVWDNKNKTIYFKSINQMGAPNPIQKAHWEFDNAPEMLPEGNMSGAAVETAMPDMSQYVTKKDFEELKEDMRKFLNQNGKQTDTFRGGDSK